MVRLGLRTDKAAQTSLHWPSDRPWLHRDSGGWDSDFRGGVSMTEKTIKVAMDEAKEFCRRATIVLSDKETVRFLGISGNKMTGALRRQSLELTRSLARMRGVI
jgi:hypothetical protein